MSRAPLTNAERARRANLAQSTPVQIAVTVAEPAAPAIEQQMPVDEPAPPAPPRNPTPPCPPIDTWVPTDIGFMRWRTITERLEVMPTPDGGAVFDTGKFQLRFTREGVDHLLNRLGGVRVAATEPENTDAVTHPIVVAAR